MLIADRSNIRGLISQLAPNFLCNFLISNGKFSVLSLLSQSILTAQFLLARCRIKQLFTAGNILEDSYKLEYLAAEERQPFKAVVRYRKDVKTSCLKNVQSTFDLRVKRIYRLRLLILTQFCISSEHAQLVARYFLLLRKLITHTVKFSTTVHGLDWSR